VSESTLSHRTRNVDIVVTTSVSSSTSVPCGDVAAGVVIIGGVTASATFTVHGSADGLTFAPVFDAGGSAATLVVPADGGAVVLPDAVFALRSLKLTSDIDLGTNVPVVVTLKS
jgi:hypothetical protein